MSPELLLLILVRISMTFTHADLRNSYTSLVQIEARGPFLDNRATSRPPRPGIFYLFCLPDFLLEEGLFIHRWKLVVFGGNRPNLALFVADSSILLQQITFGGFILHSNPLLSHQQPELWSKSVKIRQESP